MQNFEILIYLKDINYKVDFAMKKLLNLKIIILQYFFNFIFLQQYFNENYQILIKQIFRFLARKPAFIKLQPKSIRSFFNMS